MEKESKYFQTNIQTMNQRILNYLKHLEPPIDIILPEKNIQWLCPLKNTQTYRCIEQFYSKYYSDNNKRILILGINPGRFGSGITGIQIMPMSVSRMTLVLKWENHSYIQLINDENSEK